MRAQESQACFKYCAVYGLVVFYMLEIRKRLVKLPACYTYRPTLFLAVDHTVGPISSCESRGCPCCPSLYLSGCCSHKRLRSCAKLPASQKYSPIPVFGPSS